MTRKMIINAVDPDEIRIALIDDGILEQFDIESRGTEKKKGNIYKAVVADVEPSLNAAFIEYGVEKQGFLTAHDVDPRINDAQSERHPDIAKLLLPNKPKREILVQVSKDEVASKGAVLTTFLSLAGRYLVLMPDSEVQGVSRKIQDDDSRRKMREAAAKLDVPEGMGVIIRTAGQDRSRIELARDLAVLLGLWERIQARAKSAKAPAAIYQEQDVIIRTLRDYFTPDIDEVVLDSDEAFDRASEYMDLVMPKYRHVLTRYVERRPIFHHYRIEEQLETLYTPQVQLSTGGSLVIEPTEALVSIDVNSGKQKSSDQEKTALETNTSAAAEVARQVRLRDLGGIIVVDFIDMMNRRNQQKVERAMHEALKRDKARIKVGRISPNGTLEFTRQRIRTALQASLFTRCQSCNGTGHIINPASHAVSVMRKMRDRAARGDLKTACVRVEPEAANILRTSKWAALKDLEEHYSIQIKVQADKSIGFGETDFTFETDPHAKITPIQEPNFGPAPRPDYLPKEELDSLYGELEELNTHDEGEEAKSKRGKQGKKGTRNNRAEQDKILQELISMPGMPSFAWLSPREAAKAGVLSPTRVRPSQSSQRRRRRSPSSDGVISAEEILAQKSASKNAQSSKVADRRRRRRKQHQATPYAAPEQRKEQKVAAQGGSAVPQTTQPSRGGALGLLRRLFGFGK